MNCKVYTAMILVIGLAVGVVVAKVFIIIIIIIIIIIDLGVRDEYLICGRQGHLVMRVSPILL